MKIAIASLGKDINSEISAEAGRSPYYLIFEDKELIEVWKNIFSIGGGGAGTSIAKVMSDKKVDKIISAAIGEKMLAGLTEKNINYEKKTGVVKDVL